MQMKIFVACQFSDKWSLLGRDQCMLTGKRQFKRTGLKETKNKVGTENAREKKQQRLFTRLVHSLILFRCGHNVFSFNLLISWILLSGWIAPSAELELWISAPHLSATRSLLLGAQCGRACYSSLQRTPWHAAVHSSSLLFIYIFFFSTGYSHKPHGRIL